MARELGIIADDFTGALLIAGMMEAQGVSAPVFFDIDGVDPEEAGDIPILAIRSRVGPVEAALASITAAASALRRAGCRRLSYKACASFDSTEEGNIGPSADFLAGESGDLPVLMNAGFPRYNATVHQGYLFYRGRLVSDSIKRQDPLTPMTDPDLVRFLQRQTRKPIALLPHKILLQGDAAALAEWQRLLAQGACHVLTDATDDLDVAASVRLAISSGAVVVASDPLVVGFALALVGGSKGAAVGSALPAVPDGPGAVLVGSVGQTAGAQVAHFAASHPVLTIDPSAPADDAAQVAAALDWAEPRIGDQPFAIASLSDEVSVARAQAMLGPIGAARRAERLLGAIAAGLRARGIRRLVVSGGETSGAVVAALGISRVRALPEGSLGSGFCVAEAPQPMGLFLKSGKIGADDILERGLEALRPAST